ncbi:hypothetical protein BH10ACI1_BH10ACI1_09250 [soil metagenome]
MKIRYLLGLSVCLFSLSALIYAQTEILTNEKVVEMSKIGLDKQIILKKINDSQNSFNVSANSLIELKKAGVDSEIIALMLEKGELNSVNQTSQTTNNSQVFSENTSSNLVIQFEQTAIAAKDALLKAKTVAIQKSSINPSRQALEKALFNRKEWQKYNLTLVRYKNEADIYIEIGYVPLSWVTHRYVFRIYDRRSGTIITAGETTSWGNLSEHLAREITQKMDAVAGY